MKILPLLMACWAVLCCAAANAGELTPPPGPIAPTMKTLDQVEARIPISSLPLEITTPGSYYFTSNLTMSSDAAYGLKISAENVAVDLNGYALIGAGLGVGFNPGITTTGTADGFSIQNGTIRSCSGSAIALFSANRIRVERVRVTGNGGSGIQAGEAAFVSECTIDLNGSGFAASVGYASQLLNNRISLNLVGIDAADGSRIIGNTCKDHSGSGIQFSGACMVEGNTCSGNASAGISQGSGSGAMVTKNICSGNGSHGIDVFSGTVNDNMSYSNGANAVGAGINIRNAIATVERNTVANNDIGIKAQIAGGFYASNRATQNPTAAFDLGASTVGSGAAANVSF